MSWKKREEREVSEKVDEVYWSQYCSDEMFQNEVLCGLLGRCSEKDGCDDNIHIDIYDA